MIRTSPRKKIQPQTNQQFRRTQLSKQKEKLQIQKSRSPIQGSLQKPSRSARKRQSIKAYHFSNAIYQGEMRSFHRTGRGLLLHDNGLTGIIQSGSNRLKDHNIFFGQNIIISVLYKEHQIEFVYKNDQKILVLTMQRKNNAFKIKFPGFLIQMDQYMVFRLKFKNNKLVEKVALNLVQTEQIIAKQNFDKLMGLDHIDALKFRIFDSQSPYINVIEKSESLLNIGFVQTSPNEYSTTYQVSYSPQQSSTHQLHGLGFVIQKKDLDSTKQFRYKFNILSRGFYSHGRIQYFGQIYYENRNHYFGRIRGQKMHGNGLLVYEKERRFVYGQFVEGKPVRLDQNIAFRLDTQQGKAIYMNLRRKLHGEDPQVWIDNEVHDQPSPQYFLKQLHECMNFRYEDEEINNILKEEKQLWLSRKVQDFQQQSNPLYRRSLTGRLSNSLYDRNNYLTSQYLLNQSRRQEEAIRRRLEIQAIRRSRSKLQQKEKSDLKTQNLRSTRRDVELDETPIHKIHTFQNNRSELNNPQINQSIINNFTFSGEKKQNDTQKINTSSSKKQSSSIINEINPRVSQNSDSQIDINENFQNYELVEPFNINIYSPIEKNIQERSISRSMSKSSKRSQYGSRSMSRSQQGSRAKFSYVEPQKRLALNSQKKTTQKTSIIDKLYSEANLRAQRLEREYQMLQKFNSTNNSPYKNLSTRQQFVIQNNPSPSPRRRQAFDFSPSKTNQLYRQPDLTHKLIDNFMKEQHEIKTLSAANEALRLANANKVKEQKYLHYDHYTLKKRFDYTSDENDNQYPYSSKIDSQRTVRKQKVDSVVNRLYPHQNQSEFSSREYQPNKIFDSSYDQSRPLNRVGRTRQDDRTISFEEPFYKYSTGLKSSVLKHNVVVKS